MSVTVHDHTEEFQDGLTQAIDRGLRAIGATAETYAKEICPVDTGRLRNSITNEISVKEKAAYIGTNTKYAP